MIKPTLIVMAKAARVGVGKTRLAAELGRTEAWRINRVLQAHTMRVARDDRWRTLLCVTPDSVVRDRVSVWPSHRSVSHPPTHSRMNAQHSFRDPHPRTLEFMGPGLAVTRRPGDGWLVNCTSRIARACGLTRIAQGRGDLGQRLARVLRGKRFVAIIGTDCPGLARAHLVQAFAALKRKPFALGPAHDGGFWLLAARSGHAAARAMRDVRWSSAHAAADVVRNLGAANVALLPMLRDIDVAADWAAYRCAKRASSGV